MSQIYLLKLPVYKNLFVWSLTQKINNEQLSLPITLLIIPSNFKFMECSLPHNLFFKLSVVCNILCKVKYITQCTLYIIEFIVQVQVVFVLYTPQVTCLETLDTQTLIWIAQLRFNFRLWSNLAGRCKARKWNLDRSDESFWCSFVNPTNFSTWSFARCLEKA